MQNFISHKNECFFCGLTKNLSIDHFYPKEKGGISDLYNYVISCRECNSRKGNTHPKEFLSTLKTIDIKTKTLYEFSIMIHETGEVPINWLRHSRCMLCNPDGLIHKRDGTKMGIPSYYKSFVTETQEFLQHREGMCFVFIPSKERYILNKNYPLRKISAFSAEKVVKATILQGHTPDGAREFISPNTKVIQLDKFFVKQIGSCFCEVRLQHDPNKSYYVFEEFVNKFEET